MGKERDLELLEKQILNDAKNGDTTVLAEILESLDEEYIFNSLSDVNQERTNFQQLKGGERIVALVNDLERIARRDQTVTTLVDDLVQQYVPADYQSLVVDLVDTMISSAPPRSSIRSRARSSAP